MGARTALGKLDAVQGKSSEETAAGSRVKQARYWTVDFLVREARLIREVLHCDRIIPNNMPAFVPSSCLTALGQSDKVTVVSPTNLFRSVLNAFDEEETGHFWDPITKTGSTL